MSRRVMTMVATVLALASVLVAGLAAADTKEKLTEQNDKCRITVGQIKAKADQCDDDMAAAVGEMLATALANEDRFIVLASQDDGHSFQVIRKEGRASLTGIHRQADGSLLLTSDSGLQRYKPTTRSADATQGRSAPHTTTGDS